MMRSYLQLRTFSRIMMRGSVPRESRLCNTDGRSVWTCRGDCWKINYNVVKVEHCIIVSLWTFQLTLAHHINNKYILLTACTGPTFQYFLFSGNLVNQCLLMLCMNHYDYEYGTFFHIRSFDYCAVSNYLGCVDVTPGSPVMTGKTDTDINLSVVTCIENCRKDGFPIAGVQAPRTCACGTYGEKVALTGGEQFEKCNATCAGDDHQICGGADSMSIYDGKGIRKKL